MPSNLQLLVIILDGYIFIHLCHYFRYRSAALEGHRLIIEASIAGLVLFGPVRFLLMQLKRFDTVVLGEFLQRHWFAVAGGSQYSGSLLMTMAAAVILGAGWNLYHGHREMPPSWTASGIRQKLRSYWRVSKSVALEAAIDKVGNDLLTMIHEAASRWTQDLPMLGVTMNDHKLYVGWAHRAPQLTPGESHFGLFPLMSGYRDKDTLKPVLNYFYPLDPAAGRRRPGR